MYFLESQTDNFRQMKLPQSLKGTLPVVASPTALWLISVGTEELKLPSLLSLLVAVAIFFGSFLYLVKVQFARRQRNSDIAASFFLAELLGLILVSSVLLALWFAQG